MRDSFIFYRSFYEGIKELDLEEQAQIYNAIFEYQFEQKEVELTGITKAMFMLIKPQLDANNKRYENGKKGGAPTGNTNAKKQPKTTKKQPKNNLKQPNDNVNDNVNVNVNDNENNNVFEFLEINFGRTISPVEFEKINGWLKTFDEEVIKYGVEISCLNNAKTMSYLNTILNDWKSKGFTKLSEIEDRNKNKKEEPKKERVYL